MNGSEHWIGVDIGGTKVEIAAVVGGTVANSRRIPTGRQSADSLVEAVVAQLRDLAAVEGMPAGVGVGVAGRVEPATGIVRRAANLGWVDYPLRERLASAFPVPVSVLNDVQAAAFGESAFGAGQGVGSMVALFVGTGIGGGIVAGGTLLRGHNGSAGEWGHSVVDLNGPACTCGNHGCLETLAAGWGIARRAREAIGREPVAGARLLELAAGEPERLTTRMVAEAALEGDELAVAVLATAADALGAAVATIYNVLDPARIVLGGGVVDGFSALVPMVEERARGRLAASSDSIPAVVPAGLGRHAGVIGAAEWARRADVH